MSKMGKVLGPIVALLSIAAAVLSFLIAGQRGLFRDRAATLSAAVASIAGKLDEGSDSGLRNKVTFVPASPNSPKEGGSLGWESYRKARKAADGSYDRTVKQAVDLASQVQKQRNDLAAGLLEVALTLGYPSEVLPQASEMTSLAKYPASLPKVDEFAKAVVDRDQQALKSVNAIAATVRSSVSADFLKRPVEVDAEGNSTLKPYQVEKAFVPMRDAVARMRDREAELARTVAGTAQVIPAFKGWTFSAGQIARSAPKDLKVQLGRFKDDCRKINTMLAQVEVWKKDLERMKKQKAEMEDRFAALKDEKEALEKKVADFEKKFGNRSAEVDETLKRRELPVLDKMIDVPLDLAGRILKVNPGLGYAMVSLNNRQVVKDLTLAVVRKGVYVATIAVYEPGDNYSLANIFSGRIDQIRPGDDVIVSAIDGKRIRDLREERKNAEKDEEKE